MKIKFLRVHLIHLIVGILGLLHIAAASSEELSATIDFATQWEVSSLAIGTVRSVNAEVGERVSASDILIQLHDEHEKLRVQFSEYRVKQQELVVNQMQGDFDRLQILYDQADLSLTEYEEALHLLATEQHELNRVKVELDIDIAILERTKVFASVDAIVVSRNVEPGMTLTRENSFNLITLAAPNEYTANVLVPYSVRQRLSSDTEYQVAVGDQKYSSRFVLSTLKPVIVNGENLFPVGFSFRESNLLLLPGTPAMVSID